jgi:hypothetical protein
VLSGQIGFVTVAAVDVPGADNSAHVAADATRIALYIHFLLLIFDVLGRIITDRTRRHGSGLMPVDHAQA